MFREQGHRVIGRRIRRVAAIAAARDAVNGASVACWPPWPWPFDAPTDSPESVVGRAAVPLMPDAASAADSRTGPGYSAGPMGARMTAGSWRRLSSQGWILAWEMR